jgi:membrane-associated phospholipid phosphatase
MIGMVEQEWKAVQPKLWASSFLLIIGFCSLSYYYLDIPIASYFRAVDPRVESTFRYITGLGNSTWYLVASMLAFVVSKYLYHEDIISNKAIFIFLTIAISGIVNNSIKYSLGRYRPRVLFYDYLYGFSYLGFSYSVTSFPSGHANTITALMLALYFLIPEYRWLYLMVAVLVIASRVVLCDHFLSDVVFGSYLAIVTTVYVKSAFIRRRIEIFPGLLTGQAI